MIQEALITAEELAARLKVSRSTAYEMIRSGEIKAIQVGRRLRVPLASLDVWLATKVAEQPK